MDRRRLAAAVLVLLAAGAAAAGSSEQRPAGTLLDSSRSSAGRRNATATSRAPPAGSMSCTADSIDDLGPLPVAESWSEAAPLTVSFRPLERGSCVGYTIAADALDATSCGSQSPDSYILVEFWQLAPNSSSSGSLGGLGDARPVLSGLRVPHAGPGGATPGDVRVLVARGTQPTIVLGAEGASKVTPPVRDATTGLTPVGTFQDDAAVVYARPALRVFFPTDSPMTDVGEPADPNAWYVTIANLPDQPALYGYALRASCITPNAAGATGHDLRIGSRLAGGHAHNSSSNSSSSSSSSSAAAAAAGDNGVPCPVPVPGGRQCNGRGQCRADSSALLLEFSRYCDCEPGYGSWGCQLQLLSLPVNTAPSQAASLTATIAPGQWGYWEVSLPARASVSGAGGWSAGSGNEQLLLTAERLVSPGAGGNPLVFLKPFSTKDRSEPTLDALDFDVVNYADLRSFQLQLNRAWLSYRLPLRDTLHNAPPGASARAASMPRRWYVAVYNSNASRLSEPVRVKLTVTYRDLSVTGNVACPYDCSSHGRCVDPLRPLTGVRGRGGAPPPPPLPPPGSGRGLDAAAGAAALTALGPMQDQSPLDAGFMCMCQQGFGGLLCEGHVANLTVGAGEQKLGPELLEPGDWYFYVVTVDAGFNPGSSDLGIQWTAGSPAAPPNNYSTAYIAFDMGPTQRQQLISSDRRLAVALRKAMTPYSKLITRSNPPLPLQVPGNQLSPGATYVVSVLNNDYVASEPLPYSLTFFVLSDGGSFLHPYMSILLGVTAAVILCLVLTLAKRLVLRYGLVPWRWRARARRLAGRGDSDAGSPRPGRDALALVLLAQSQQGSRGVPAEVYQAFPCRPFAAKEYQQRQHDVAQAASAQAGAGPDAGREARPDQTRGGGAAPAGEQPAGAPARAAAAEAEAAGDIELGAAPQRQVNLSAGAGRQPGAEAALVTAAAKPPGRLSSASDQEQHQARATKDVDAAEWGSVNDEAPSCTICLCEYVAGELVRQLPACGHEFHMACIDQWMGGHSTCPICRAALWHGAPELQELADAASDSTNDDQPAIFVHHAGGLMPGLRQQPAGAAAGGAAAAGAGMGPGLQLPLALTPLWAVPQHAAGGWRQQQQPPWGGLPTAAGHPLAAGDGGAAPHAQRRSSDVSRSSAAGAAAHAAGAGGEPPEHELRRAAAVAEEEPAEAAGRRFLGAFALGRRRQPPPQQLEQPHQGPPPPPQP